MGKVVRVSRPIEGFIASLVTTSWWVPRMRSRQAEVVFVESPAEVVARISRLLR